jgi:hypothetical protein
LIIAASTNKKKEDKGKLRLYGSNTNYKQTYIWCESKASLDPTIASDLKYDKGANLALEFDADSPTKSKIISEDYDSNISVLCED